MLITRHVNKSLQFQCDKSYNRDIVIELTGPLMREDNSVYGREED